jgi:hypothetical protein
MKTYPKKLADFIKDHCDGVNVKFAKIIRKDKNQIWRYLNATKPCGAFIADGELVVYSELARVKPSDDEMRQLNLREDTDSC